MIVILGGGPARIASLRLCLGKGRGQARSSRGYDTGSEADASTSADAGLRPERRGTVPRHGKEVRGLCLTGPAPLPDFPRILEQMQAVQAKIAGILDHETRGAGVDIIYGRAGRLDGKTIWLDEERIVPDAVIVATGSRSNIPPVASIALPGVSSREPSDR